MILTKRFWIILITIALLGIFALIFKNKITIKQKDNTVLDANSAEIYEEHKFDNGESLYNRYCTSCHGNLEIDQNGTGTAPPLNHFGNVWKLSSNNIAKKILFSSFAKKDSKMPSFAGMLKENQVKDIITYIIYGLPAPYRKERQRLLHIPLPKNVDTIHESSDEAMETDSNQVSSKKSTHKKTHKTKRKLKHKPVATNSKPVSDDSKPKDTVKYLLK